MSNFASRFEDLLIWQDARSIAGEVYSLFKVNRDFGFRDQIQRASVSVMNNIAEGFERKTKVEFARFLDIAKASCGEVRSMLYLANDIGYVENYIADEMIKKCALLSKRISSFKKCIEK
jgi:four helix bundle protein